MKPKSIRFGLDYVKNDMEVDLESLPEGLSSEGRLFYAELSKEQKAWNAQWYSEDHNDARRDQRRFFLMYLQHNLPAITQSLYQVLPSFRQIFAGDSDSSSMRFGFLQSMMMSFNHDYLKVSETRREEVDRIIEEIVEKSLVPKPSAPKAVRPSEPDTSEWEGVILQQVYFKAMQRLLPHDAVLEETEGSIDERFTIVYRPLYRCTAGWRGGICLSPGSPTSLCQRF